MIKIVNNPFQITTAKRATLKNNPLRVLQITNQQTKQTIGEA